MNKGEIRKLIFKRLSELEQKAVSDRLIADRLLSNYGTMRALSPTDETPRLSCPAGGTLNIFIYNSLPSEVDTKGIIEHLLYAGHNVYLPRINGKEMSLIAIDGDTEYIQNSYGIAEPVGEPYSGDVDICIVPLVAFDRGRVRLGRGGGFYDRFLHNSKAYKIAIAYSVQEYQAIPAEPHDIRMDIIVTEREIIV